eukprot:gene14976-17702_t
MFVSRSKVLLPLQEGQRRVLGGVGMSDYPVSLTLHPRVDLLVREAGTHEMESDSITHWGEAQRGLAAWATPSRADILLAALASRSQDEALLDVGAGNGRVSLAAAAAGRSIGLNRLGHHIELYNGTLASPQFPNPCTSHTEHLSMQQCLESDMKLSPLCHTRLPYFNPLGVAIVPPPKQLDGGGAKCMQRVVGWKLEDLLPAGVNGSTALPGAISLRAGGAAGWALEGLEDLMKRHQPAAVLVEVTLHTFLRTG